MSNASPDKQHWASLQEAGTYTGLRFLFFLHRYLGRGFFSLLMYPVACYFVLCKPFARRASQRFLRYHWQHCPDYWARQPNWLHCILHFKHFAEAILDKALAWSADINHDDFIIERPELIESLMADHRGQLIIGTHFGNLEYCRGFMQRYRNKVINILVYDKHSANFVKIMQTLNADSRMNIFQVDEFDVPTILRLKQKIAQGEWVFIAGDRIPLEGLQHTVQANFLGHSAPLPMGPYLLAKTLECPVKLMFGYRHPRYGAEKIYFEVVPFAEQISFGRRDRAEKMQGYAQAFADHLQRHCEQAPYQWFNFYDFWGCGDKQQ